VFAFLAGNGAGPVSVDEALPVTRTHERRHLRDRRHAVAA